MKEQISAVKWLVEKIQQANPSFKFDALIREAIKMEKEQMEDSYCFGILDSGEDGLGFNHYYNETFKSE